MSGDEQILIFQALLLGQVIRFQLLPVLQNGLQNYITSGSLPHCLQPQLEVTKCAFELNCVNVEYAQIDLLVLMFKYYSPTFWYPTHHFNETNGIAVHPGLSRRIRTE